LHVMCPGCSSRYEMPARLLGPAGARVCCPSCWLSFVIGPGGELVSVIGRAGDQADGATADVAPAAPPDEAPTNGVAAHPAVAAADDAAALDDEDWPDIDEADYGPLHGIDFLEAAPDADAPDAEFAAALGATVLTPAAPDRGAAAAAPGTAATALATPDAAPGAAALDAGAMAAEYPDPPHSASLAALLDLDVPPGTLALAAADGRLFATHGPALLAAYEALARDRPGADVAVEFRAALLELTGLDLPHGSPA